VIGKLCAAPRGGGSARNAIFYVLAEELTAKVSHAASEDAVQARQRAELSSVIAEANRRLDLGVGAIWAPQTGDGRRPSAIYARGVYSLGTADIEMEAIASTQPRLRGAVSHYVLSVSEEQSKTITDEAMVRAAELALDRAGFSDHQAIFAVHRDTANVHCHVAVAKLNARTFKAYNREGDSLLRLHTGLRHAEIAFGLEEDWGKAIIRDRGLSTERIEKVGLADWKLRHQERAEERIENAVRKFLSEEEGLESLDDRRDRFTYAVGQYLDRCHDLGETPLQSDVHLIAAQLALTIEPSRNGKMVLRVMEKADGQMSRGSKTDSFGSARLRFARWVPTPTIMEVDPTIVARSPLHDAVGRNRATKWVRERHDAALAHQAWLLGLGDLEAAEREFLAVVRADPGRVTRTLINGGQATFTTADLDRLVASHVTDDWSDFVDLVLREDRSIRVLTPDTETVLMTTARQQELTHEFVAIARELMRESDPLFDRAILDQSVLEVEAELRQLKPGFVGFSDEQRRVFDGFEKRLFVVQGDAGTGKTVLQRVQRRMAELQGRRPVAFATAQKAAKNIQIEAGIDAVNQARNILHEELGKGLMVEGSRFTGEEGSMWSIEHGLALMKRARSTNSSGLIIGDLSQLPNLNAGDTFGLWTRVAAQEGALRQLTGVRRPVEGSTVEWMREWVPKGGRAIRTENAEEFAEYLQQFIDRGHVTFHETRTSEVEATAADIVAAMQMGVNVIAPGRSWQDCYYINRAVRDGLGLTGKGQRFAFDRGAIELAVGDRIMFRQNNAPLGVLNSETGTVMRLSNENGSWRIAVVIDGDGRTVDIDPCRYHRIEYGYATTIHSQQGAGAPLAVPSITKSDDARSAHASLTRAMEGLKIHTRLSPEEFIRHLTSPGRMASKDDALLFQRVVQKTGGPETPWARAVAAARKDDQDPLRIRQREDMARVEAERGRAIQTYLRANTAAPARKRDREVARIAARYPSLSFMSWAAAERTQLQHEWERTKQHSPTRTNQSFTETDRLTEARSRRRW
jgi:hypothetical protein